MDLELIPIEEQYYEFVRLLRIHPDTITGFIYQGHITPDEQIQYMNNHRDDYFICLYKNKPVGFIGVVNNDLRLAVDSQYTNQGFASFMLQNITKYKNDFEVRVKIDNIPSQKLFEKNGYKRKNVLESEGIVLFEKGL